MTSAGGPPRAPAVTRVRAGPARHLRTRPRTAAADRAGRRGAHPGTGRSSRSNESSSARISSSSGCSSACCAKGHVLLEGVPGVAKTLAVETFARVVGGNVRPHPVHPRPGAHRHRRYPDLPAGQGRVRHRARPGGRQLPARRRDQPCTGQGAVGAAGGHGRNARCRSAARRSRCPTRSW